MRQILNSRSTIAVLAALCFGALVLVGCGKDPAPASGGGTTANTGGGGAAPGGGAAEPGDEPTGGEGTAGDATLSGKVVLKGEAPKNMRVDMIAHPDCAKQHGDAPVFDTKWAVGEGNAVQWVFVYVFKGDGVVGKKWAKPTTAVTIDQKGCMYEPRVFGVFPGQTITVLNSDPVMHNIHAQPGKSAEFNESMQPGAAPLSKTIDRSEVLVPIKCDVHSWMHAYAGVVNHPYFAVTDAKGAYSIGKLPAGTYTIRAIHESGKKSEKEIEVKAGETATLDFEIEPK